MSERILHCTSEGAYKFWQVSLAGTIQTVRYGRIGTEGQSVKKSFESEDVAHAATEKIIAQKLAKGYVAVSAEQAVKAPPKRRPTRQLLLPFDEPIDQRAVEAVALSLF